MPVSDRKTSALRRFALAVCCLLLGGMLFVAPLQAQTPAAASAASGSTEILSPAERLWLVQNQARLVLAVETGYAPFVFLDERDQVTGLAHDYLRLIESKLGVHFAQRRFSSLDDVFTQIRDGQVHLVNAVTPTPRRSEFLLFTAPVISLPNVIIVRRDRDARMTEGDLAGLVVSLVKSYAATEYLAAKNLGLTAKLVPDDLSALLDVSFGRADATVVDLATASDLIERKGITNLRVAGEIGPGIALSIGSAKSEPMLHSILQTGLSAITKEEARQIRERWINHSGSMLFLDWRFWSAIVVIVLVVLVILAATLLWNRTLRQQVAHRVAQIGKEQAALLESEKRFRGLIEQSLTGIYVTVTETGVFQFANRRLEQILGYAEGELVGVRTEDIVLAQDMPIVLADRAKLRAGATACSYEVRVRRKDGAVIELGVQGSLYQYGGESTTVGMAQDITEKKRAEEEIKRYVAELEAAFTSTVQVATTLSGMRDPYTASHERRVAEIAVAIGAELGLTERQLEGLRAAGHLHDIGKITVPAEILSKPGKLSALEYRLIQEHAQAGYEVLKDVKFPWQIADIVRQHHERMDGSGYPQGLKGEEILLKARIIAVADVVEAMSSHRPYRATLGIEAALAEIEQGRGRLYDAQVVDVCLKLFRDKGYKIHE